MSFSFKKESKEKQEANARDRVKCPICDKYRWGFTDSMDYCKCR